MKWSIKRSIGALMLAGVLGLASLGPSSAQADFEDAKLKSFVTAAISVSQLIQQWTPRIQNAENKAQAEELTQQANAEIEAAVEKTGGITVEEYKQIAQAAQADPELTARIEKIFRDQTQQQQ